MYCKKRSFQGGSFLRIFLVILFLSALSLSVAGSGMDAHYLRFCRGFDRGSHDASGLEGGHTGYAGGVGGEYYEESSGLEGETYGGYDGGPEEPSGLAGDDYEGREEYDEPEGIAGDEEDKGYYGCYNGICGPFYPGDEDQEPDMHVLEIEVTGEGDTFPSEGTHLFEKGRSVSIESDPDLGWVLDGFSGDCSGSSCSVTMDGDRYVHVDFDRSDDEEDNDEESNDDDGSSEDEDGYEYTHRLSVDVEGEGYVNPSEGNHVYSEGESVGFKVRPDTGWEFDGFSGDCSGDECSLEMDEDRDVDVVFERSIETTADGEGSDKDTEDDSNGSNTPAEPINGYRVVDKRRRLDVDVKGRGSVNPSEGVHSYEYGRSVTFEAEPDEGYVFDGFSGDCSGTFCTVQMTEDRNVSVVFNKNDSRDTFDGYGKERLVVDVDGQGSVNPSAGSYMVDGRSYQVLRAEPDPGWRFVGWEGDVKSDGLTAEVYMSGSRRVTASFVRKDNTEAVKTTEPYGITLDAHGVTSGGAVIRGELVEDGGEDVNMLFRYRRKGEKSWRSSFTRTLFSETTVEHELEGLEPSTEYEYKAVYGPDGSYGPGDVRSFTTDPESMIKSYGNHSLVYSFDGLSDTSTLRAAVRNPGNRTVTARVVMNLSQGAMALADGDVDPEPVSTEGKLVWRKDISPGETEIFNLEGKNLRLERSEFEDTGLYVYMKEKKDAIAPSGMLSGAVTSPYLSVVPLIVFVYLFFKGGRWKRFLGGVSAFLGNLARFVSGPFVYLFTGAYKAGKDVLRSLKGFYDSLEIFGTDEGYFDPNRPGKRIIYRNDEDSEGEKGITGSVNGGSVPSRMSPDRDRVLRARMDMVTPMKVLRNKRNRN